MLELRDLFLLPEAEPLVERLIEGGPGLTLVAGLDPCPLPPSGAAGTFLPSGRATIYRILARQILVASSVKLPSCSTRISLLPRSAWPP